MRKPNPRNPQMRGDFGDIGDIFRKPSNHAVLPVFEFGDILGMSPMDGDGRRGMMPLSLPACLTRRRSSHRMRLIGPFLAFALFVG